MDAHKRRKLRNIFDAIIWNAPELEKICKVWGISAYANYCNGRVRRVNLSYHESQEIWLS